MKRPSRYCVGTSHDFLAEAREVDFQTTPGQNQIAVSQVARSHLLPNLRT